MTPIRAGTLGFALLMAGCGGVEAPPAADNAGVASGNDVAGSAVATNPEPSAGDQASLIVPASWMPADWDRDVYAGSGEQLDDQAIRRARQGMLNTVPFTLWAVANDSRVTEAFEPIWVWYAAIRSCARGIELSEDLAGEFGNRDRGKMGLTRARDELKRWAATQPRDMTLYFSATLGEWNAERGTFQLGSLSKATTLKPGDVESIDPYFDGANVELWSDRSGQAINHFQASLVAPQCASADRTKVYKFQRQSQWWVVFGDVDRGMGGLPDYKSRAMLPVIAMTRERAADFAQRNRERKVIVAVTFAPAGSSFVKGIDQSAIRAAFRKVTITDATDNSVLVAKEY